jgi:hypothetical protein
MGLFNMPKPRKFQHTYMYAKEDDDQQPHKVDIKFGSRLYNAKGKPRTFSTVLAFVLIILLIVIWYLLASK